MKHPDLWPKHTLQHLETGGIRLRRNCYGGLEAFTGDAFMKLDASVELPYDFELCPDGELQRAYLRDCALPDLNRLQSDLMSMGVKGASVHSVTQNVSIQDWHNHEAS